MHLKRQNSWPPDVSTLDALNDYTGQRHLAEKVVLSALYTKRIFNFDYIQMRRKIIDDF